MSSPDTAPRRERREPSPPDAAPRTVDRTLEIDAPLGAVWRALTDADELTRWFPLEARVEPGVGGSIWMRWADVYQGGSRIEAWEPERHLRIAFPHDAPGPLLTDYYLEGRGGRTVLRVVTSGFGTGATWDDMYDGVQRGWQFELHGLRHYLERHRGENRVVAWVRLPYALANREAWQRLTAPGGWLGADGLNRLEVGGPYEARTPDGTTLAGTVHAWQPPAMFVGTVKGLRDGLLRLELETWTNPHRVSLWLSSYGPPEDDLRNLETAWRASITETLA